MSGRDERLLAALRAVKNGDLSVRLEVEEPGVHAEIVSVFNAMMAQISALVSEINRLTTELGSEGRLGGQSEIEGLSGSWLEMQNNVNGLEYALTGQIRRMSLMVELMANNGRVLPLPQSGDAPENEMTRLEHNIARMARKTAEPVS